MTCIVGIVDKDRTILGCDSAAVDVPNRFIEQWKTPKVFKKGDFLFAFAGSYTVGQIIKMSLVLPDIANLDIDTYLVTKFIPVLKKLLNKSDLKEDESWTLLLAYKNRLFVLEDGFGLGEPLEGYTADGAGRDFALGSLTSSLISAAHLSAEEHLTLSLKAAEKYSADVKGPFTLIST